MLKFITPVLFFFTCMLFGQNEQDSLAKTAYNLHVNYINECSYYIDATQQSLKAFNKTLNAYAELLEAPDVINHEAIQLANGRTEIDQKERLALISNKFDSLAFSRTHLPPNIALPLENGLIQYQNVFIQITNIVSELLNLTANKALFFEDIRFKRAYLLLQEYEKNLSELAVVNRGFSNTLQNLNGHVELPKTLDRANKIVLLSKKMMFELSEGEIDSLKNSMVLWQQQFQIHIDLNDREVLENYGDFPYLDIELDEERQAIDFYGKLIYHWTEKYIKGEELFTIEKEYTRDHRFEELLISLFNGQGFGLAQKYNNYVNRSTKPILNNLNEVPPFKLTYPEKIILPNENITLLTPMGIKKLLFNLDDVSTLDGALTNNIVLLLDVSLSMRYDEKLDRLKSSVSHLIKVLRDKDKLTVVTYAGEAKKVFETSVGSNKEDLITEINNLKPTGKSNGKAGLVMAYDEVLKNYIHGGNNRIIIASDGIFHTDIQLEKLIKTNLEKEIYLSTFFYLGTTGKTPKKDVLRELSILGGGHYIQIQEKSDAIKALVTEAKKQHPKSSSTEKNESK